MSSHQKIRGLHGTQTTEIYAQYQKYTEEGPIQLWEVWRGFPEDWTTVVSCS